VNRRAACKLLLAAGATGCRRPASKPANTTMTTTTDSSATNMPVIFLAHGSPLLLDDAGWMRELGAWAAAMPRPKAVLMLSAHWVDQPIARRDAASPARLRLLAFRRSTTR
jgi:4,5-DOPA dioxygenase extradiol